jgi:hypothetical protein
MAVVIVAFVLSVLLDLAVGMLIFVLSVPLDLAVGMLVFVLSVEPKRECSAVNFLAHTSRAYILLPRGKAIEYLLC